MIDNKNNHPELRQDPVPQEDDNQQRSLIQDEYPANWNVEEFKALPSFKKRVTYAKEKLGKLGTGSARVVFEIDEDKVLKLARNKKGLAQNDLESDIAATGWYDFVAQVYDADPDNLWIESEKAVPMKKSDFKNITGFDFEDWGNVLLERYRELQRSRGGTHFVVPDNYDEILEDELFNDIMSFIMDYDIAPGDFARITSWGIVNREGHEVPVLIDYGVSRSIYNDYYVRK
jgi:hypothetical protein